MSEFRNPLGQSIFDNKYARFEGQTWLQKCHEIVEDVCGPGVSGRSLMSAEERERLVGFMADFKFVPGGRYIYYAGRDAGFYNNCYLLRGEEDTREEWGALCDRAMSCLMSGGGIGVDYSVFRGAGSILGRTGGEASGPIPLMKAINELGRQVMQGGSRRSAIYASLDWQHPDAADFLFAKDWDGMAVGRSGYTLADAKNDDFNFPAPLDMTNISLNYGDNFLAEIADGSLPTTFMQNVRQAMKTGEPGFSFNFGAKGRETLRNACTEVTSEDDSDVCNLGSVNFAACSNLDEAIEVIRLATKFLVCGTIRAELPYKKVYEVRDKNRRLGLGLMGLHEWLLQRGERYEVTTQLHSWLSAYEAVSEYEANKFCDELGVSRPVAYRAIAPTGTIGILAGTTTGIEPIFSVATKRRYLVGGDQWKYEYTIDPMAEQMIDEAGADPDSVETAAELATDPERRIRFQAEIQDYVDMAISSTINLPAWGSEHNNDDRVTEFAHALASYAHRLRGFTVYPDGSRGGQPLTPVPYDEAKGRIGVVYEETSDRHCKSGVCGI